MARRSTSTTLVLALCAAAITPALANSGTGVAILQLDPVAKGKQHKLSGIFGDWSIPESKIEGAPVVAAPEEDPHGCKKQPRCVGCALYVQQGSCTFEQKAKNAQAAGAKLLIVAAKEEGPPVGMTAGSKGFGRPKIPAVMISKKDGRQLTLALSRGEVFKASCWETEIGIYGDIISELFVGFLAVFMVAFGAWYSVEDLRNPGQTGALAEDVVAVDVTSGPHFVVMGSIMLTVLFFFMKYLIYGLLFVFATGAISTTTVLLEPLLARCFPSWRRIKACHVPTCICDLIGIDEEQSLSDFVSCLVGGVLAVGFLLFRNNPTYGWVFQDIIAIGLLLTIQRTLRLPNLKVGTIMLVCTFFFDIFWVFISPLIFQKSVMIEVATGGGTGQSVPMVLKIPAMISELPGQFKILGLGDIAIPGLLISMLLRHDLTKGNACCTGYFTWGVIGYAIGLGCTFISLYLMQHGQPALLFLVPGTLIPTVAIALRKGELGALWNADYSPPALEGYERLEDGVDKQA